MTRSIHSESRPNTANTVPATTERNLPGTQQTQSQLRQRNLPASACLMCPAGPLGGCGQRAECPSRPPRGSAQDKRKAGGSTAAFREHTGNVIRIRGWPSFAGGAWRNQPRAECGHLSGAGTLLRSLGRSAADRRPWTGQAALEQVSCMATETAVPSLPSQKHLGWAVEVELLSRLQEHMDIAHLGHLQL